MPAATNRRRILVVDDNQDSAESLATLLTLKGNETHTASDGQEAVETAARLRPDVILLDIGLPKMNGYEACRRIREQPGGDDVVIIALTGWGQGEDRRRSREAGFNEHLVRTLDPAVLMKLLAATGAWGLLAWREWREERGRAIREPPANESCKWFDLCLPNELWRRRKQRRARTSSI